MKNPTKEWRRFLPIPSTILGSYVLCLVLIIAAFIFGFQGAQEARNYCNDEASSAQAAATAAQARLAKCCAKCRA